MSNAKGDVIVEVVEIKLVWQNNFQIYSHEITTTRRYTQVTLLPSNGGDYQLRRRILKHTIHCSAKAHRDYNPSRFSQSRTSRFCPN